MAQDIFDFNLELSHRVNTLLTLSPDEQYETVRRLLDIYRLSKSKKIEKFFISLCIFDRRIDPRLKLEMLYLLKEDVGSKNGRRKAVYEAFSNTAFVFASRVSENAGYWRYAKKALMEFVETFQDEIGPRSLLYSTTMTNFRKMPIEEMLAFVFQYRKFDFFSHFTQTLFAKFREQLLVKDQLVLLQTFRENEQCTSTLWSILENEDNLLRDRLEACDMLISGGNVECAERARAKKILEHIVPKEDYTSNAENAHLPSIARSVEKTVSALLQMNLGQVSLTSEQVITRVSSMLGEADQKRLRVVLGRIFGYDFLKFTTHSLTLKDIFGQVWLFIQKSPHISELMVRLVQELLDMFDTCSQGYVCRLVNVLSGFGSDLGVRLDYEDEIYAIFSTKVNKLLSEAPEALRDKLLEELTISSSEPDRRANLLKYLRPRVPGVWNEIFEVFQEELTVTDLDLYCRKVMMKYEGTNLK